MQDDLISLFKLPSGETVYIVRGLFTASSRDPRREAKHWIENKVFDEGTLIVGGGSAYHLQELSQILPSLKGIILLEPHPQLARQIKDLFPEIKITSLAELLNVPESRDLIRRFYIFRPAIQWCPNLANTVTELFRSTNYFETVQRKDAITSLLEEFVK